MPSLTTICIVGAGPRGLSVLERLCANERQERRHSAVTIHVVDPSPPGAGTVWRVTQSRHLVMNTIASQITVFTDESVRIAGPIVPGPSLYDWAKQILQDEETDLDDLTLAEARDLEPNSYPTRAFYGRYLQAGFRTVIEQAAAHITVQVHRSRAVALASVDARRRDGAQRVRLENGTWLEPLDAVVMAQGHVAERPTPQEERNLRLARIHRLDYLAPANPADVDLSRIRPGRPVLLRGLGLCFFDYMALLTTGRGGTYAREGERLVYHPSGEEPLMFASSRRGIPYHARGENEKGVHGRHQPRLLTAERIAALRRRCAEDEPMDFRQDLWPLIAREVESVYYGSLLANRGAAQERETFVTRYLGASSTELPALLADYGFTHEDRWDWDRLERPYGKGVFGDREDFRAWLLEYLAQDVREARAGNVSGPLKAALDVLRDLRNEIRLAVDHGGIDGDSYRDDLQGWYTPLNAFLSIGPPASRIEETAALIEAGVLELIGPAAEVRLDTHGSAFVARSPLIPGPPVRATTLIEARLPEPDLRRTDDPLLLHLLSTGQAVPHRIPGACGTSYETGGLAVSERPYRLLDTLGQVHPRRFAYGVPTEAVHWATAAGIRPGVDSVTLGDSDAIACAVLALPALAATTVDGECAVPMEPMEVVV
ncbi:FAD/NAD(P)-binding protein [Streptomyces sp. NBC_00986]|uniref:FAD/NAD(P)-binding protein n=1 Tax=Streptomyces sp. NBC_00986 TaxID=2903702 RepID=UPI003869253B|nr:FAD/NAD(P)-binding protein [Streptomyces sp. NBC_00986]